MPGDVAELPATPHATLALFAYAGVVPGTVDCLLRDFRMWPNLIYYRVSNDALISRSRSRAASDFLQAKRELTGDILLMLDHDIVWGEGDLQHIAEKVSETGGIVAGIYSKRNFGDGTATRFGSPGEYTIGEDKIVEAEYVSTGFMGIHRNVLEKLAEKMPKTIGNFYPFFLPMIAEQAEGMEYLSEDWAFVLRARQLGFTVHAALKPRLTHVGDHGYRLIDSMASPPPDHPVTFALAPEPDMEAFKSLLRDTSDFTEIGMDQMHKVTQKAQDGIVTLWHRHASDLTTREEWFAREDVGRCQILIQAARDRDLVAPAVAKTLNGLKDKRVLDLSPGAGSLAIQLATQGNEVDCVEVNPKVQEFIQFRAEKHLEDGKSLRFVETPDGEYDVIIAFHVFDCATDPIAALESAVTFLKPGGRIISHSEFQADPHYPMRQVRDDWDARLQDAGLYPTAQPFWYEKVAPVEVSDGAQMYLDPADNFVCASLRATGAWDEDVAEAIRTHLKPDWFFLDIGAHVGYLTMVAAPRCEKVLAIEPAPIAFSLLEKSVALNGFDNVDLKRVAVSDQEGKVNLVLTPGNTGEAHTQAKATKESIPVDAAPLAALLNGRWPEFVKIDVEGDEGKVLASCPELLEHAKVLAIEFSDGQLQRNSGCTTQDIIATLEAADFTVTILSEHPTYGNLLALKEAA